MSSKVTAWFETFACNLRRNINMDGITKDSIKTAKLMKQFMAPIDLYRSYWWSKRYTNGKNTAIFTEVEGDTIVGLALCSLRFDYVEGCKYSPVGFLEGIIVDEEYRLRILLKISVQNVRNGRKIRM